MKTIIAPSLLAADFSNLQKELQLLENIENLWIHLDIMDGHFVPNLSFGATVLKNLHLYTKHPLDAHLMVENPQDYLEALSRLRLHNFTFHLESKVNHPLAFIAELKKVFPSVGVTIKPATSVEKITDEILNAVDLVLIMSVEPGFGGQGYIEGSEDKIKWLKNKRFELNTKYLIQVDGGINSETYKKVTDAGADILVAGSHIFKKDNYQLAVSQIRDCDE